MELIMTEELMDAAIFQGDGVLELKKIKIPEINGNQALVKILAASICGSDLHILEVPQAHSCETGIVLGHEAVGEIVELGKDIKSFKIGDRVAIDPITPCGNCPLCKTGYYNMCNDNTAFGVDIDGVFAQYSAIREDRLHKLSRDMPIKRAIFAEPVACVFTAIRKLNFYPGQTVVILGSGPIGLYFSKILKANGASLIVLSEIADYRINFAKKYGEATHVINPKVENIRDIVFELTEGIGVDYVVDTVGTCLPDALKLVKRAGKVLLFGINDFKQQILKQYDIIRNDITVIGSFVTYFAFPEVINMLETKTIILDDFVTHEYSLNEIHKGIDVLRKGKAMEVIVYPNG